MFDEEFNYMTDGEQKEFQRIANKLLTNTFLVKKMPDFENNNFRFHADYIFVEERLELFQQYFAFMGGKLKKDDIIDVISFSSEFNDNRIHLNLFETKCLIILRLLYEELREKISLSLNSLITVSDLIDRLSETETLKKKITNTNVSAALKKLQRYHIIEKGSGPWTDSETQICILPSIMVVITNEQYRMLVEKGENDEKDK